MSYKDNADLRNRSAGAYSFHENIFWEIFSPLLDVDGGMVYLALCRLIPLASVVVEKQVTMRRLEEASRVSRSQVNRKLQEVLALGMVSETRYTRNRPATYVLHPLVELAAVGREELCRRLLSVIDAEDLARRLSKDGKVDFEMLKRIGVPPRDTAKQAVSHTPVADKRVEDPESRTGGGLSQKTSKHEEGSVSDVSKPSTGGGVPPWDTATNQAEAEFSPDSVSHTEASVSHTEASVSHTEASVSQGERAFNTRRRIEVEKDLTPLPPVPGGERDDGPILAFTDCRHGDPGFELSLGHAARWVMREAGLVPATRGAAKRIERAIVGALTFGARNSRQPLDEVARIALVNFRDFCADAPLMRFAWGPEKFFSQGHWCRPHTWPYDETKRAARVGM